MLEVEHQLGKLPAMVVAHQDGTMAPELLTPMMGVEPHTVEETEPRLGLLEPKLPLMVCRLLSMQAPRPLDTVEMPSMLATKPQATVEAVQTIHGARKPQPTNHQRSHPINRSHPGATKHPKMAGRDQTHTMLPRQLRIMLPLLVRP